MKILAKNTSEMVESGIRVIMHKSAGIPSVIHLEGGQPSFNTPEHIIKAAYQSMMDGFTGYTPSAGYESLRELIAEKVTKVNRIRTTVDNVVVTAGGGSGITATLFALIDPDDEVMIPDPHWPNYTMAIACCAGKPVCYPCYKENGFLPDLIDIETRITNKTKVIMLNTPANPTGAVFPPYIIEGIVDIARRFDLYIISDEAYEDIVFDGKHMSAGAFDTENRVISVFTFSKSYAMTGWRLGYNIAAVPIAELLTKIQEPFYSCAPSLSQKAAEAALAGPQKCVKDMVRAYRRRRDLAIDIFKPKGLITNIPQGTFYMLVDISRTNRDSSDFAFELLQKRCVAVAPGISFGNLTKDYVRISLATDEKLLLEGLLRLCEFIRDL